jgi:hypothetical protein
MTRKRVSDFNFSKKEAFLNIPNYSNTRVLGRCELGGGGQIFFLNESSLIELQFTHKH